MQPMNPEQPCSLLLSRSPFLPRWAIVILAVLLDLAVVTTFVDRFTHSVINSPAPVQTLEHYLYYLREAVINDNPMVNAGVVLLFLYPNSEVAYMILTKATYRAEIAEAVRQAEAKAKAEAKAWFKQYQADPASAPPPPWSHNGTNPE